MSQIIIKDEMIWKIIKYTSRIVFGLLTLFWGLVGLASCNDNSNDPAEILRQRIESAEMVEYTDTIYGAKLLYPDFFKIDSVGKCYASFSYSDENIMELNLFYFIFPPRLFDNSKEAVRKLSDSLTTSSKVKGGSFILAQEYEQFPQIKDVSKYYHTRHGWTSYTLTYDKQYEDAVERLIKMVKNWKIYEEDIPKWLTDIFDFLDI